MDKTKIDWCDSTWNPCVGCYHDCEYCYARGIAKRFSTEDKCHSFYDGKPMGKIHVLDNPARVIETGKISPYPFGFEPTFHRYRLNEYQNKKGRNIFVCSMADLFGDWVSDEWLDEVFAACEKAPQHNYLFLTKNPERYMDLVSSGKLSEKDNMWYGSTATTENSTYFHSNKHKTFLSIEPLLGSFSHAKEALEGIDWGIDWVIIGAMTGPGSKDHQPERVWVENIVESCRTVNVPVFMKQSLAPIWGEQLIQEFPQGLRKKGELC